MLEQSLSLPSSTIVMPIEYSVDSLTKIINTKVTGTFLKKWIVLNTKNDSLYIELTKTGAIKTRWDKTTLHYTFPVKVSGKFIKRMAGIKFKNTQPVDMSLILHLQSVVKIGNDWDLQTTSTLKKIEWIKDPSLKIAMFQINLRKKTEEAITKNQDELIAKMDETLGSLLNTKKVIAKIWTDIQKPIRINKHGEEVWLKPYANDLRAKLIQRNGMLTLLAELEADVHTVVSGDSFPASNTRLPKFKAKRSDNDSLQIFLLATLPFKKINEILNAELRGKKIEASGYSSTLKRIWAYGTDNGIALRLELKGDASGKIYARGKPEYNPETHQFIITDFGYDLDTENALVNSANWLLRENTLSLIQDKLSVDALPYIEQLPGIIENAIDGSKTGEKIDLNIEALHVKPKEILITKDHIQILIVGYGKASINLQNEAFAKKKR